MKTLPLLFASAALVMSGAAVAQTAPMPEATPPAAETTTPAPDATTPATTTAFTDAEIESFASAALKIQELEGKASVTQEQLSQIVTESGLEPATYVAILQAMKNDEALAQRVQIAATALQSKATG